MNRIGGVQPSPFRSPTRMILPQEDHADELEVRLSWLAAHCSYSCAGRVLNIDLVPVPMFMNVSESWIEEHSAHAASGRQGRAAVLSGYTIDEDYPSRAWRERSVLFWSKHDCRCCACGGP